MEKLLISEISRQNQLERTQEQISQLKSNGAQVYVETKSTLLWVIIKRIILLEKDLWSEFTYVFAKVKRRKG